MYELLFIHIVIWRIILFCIISMNLIMIFLIAGIPLGIKNITHGNHKHYLTNHRGHIKREKYDLQTKIQY